MDQQAQPRPLWQVFEREMHESPHGWDVGPQCLQQVGGAGVSAAEDGGRRRAVVEEGSSAVGSGGVGSS